MLSAEEMERLLVRPGRHVRLADFATDGDDFPSLAALDRKALKSRAQDVLAENREQLSKAQELLWANDTWSVLLILQGMDTSGKDGVIKHVFSGMNPLGCQAVSFRAPSDEELDHNFLWRYMKHLPERGRIGIFNRSWYEETLIARVVPAVLARQKLPPISDADAFWADRYDDINALEQHLVRNGTQVLKCFLHLGRDEQKARLLERIDNPDKHWKFDPADLQARAQWDRYQQAYEAALSATSTAHAPWHVIPADNKPLARALVAMLLCRVIGKLPLHQPLSSAEKEQQIAQARRALLAE